MRKLITTFCLSFAVLLGIATTPTQAGFVGPIVKQFNKFIQDFFSKEGDDAISKLGRESPEGGVSNDPTSFVPGTSPIVRQTIKILCLSNNEKKIIIRDDTFIYLLPSDDAAITGKLKLDDKVCIREEKDSWGNLDNGWIKKSNYEDYYP